MKKTRFIPYGYTMRNGRTVIEHGEADIIRYIFDEYIKGASLKDLAEELTARKVPYTEKTEVWDTSALRADGTTLCECGCHTSWYRPPSSLPHCMYHSWPHLRRIRLRGCLRISSVLLYLICSLGSRCVLDGVNRIPIENVDLH